MAARRMGTAVAAVVATLVIAAGASAAGVTYIEDGNVWVASPDGAHKVQLTTDGTPSQPWYVPSQSVDGRSFAVQRTSWSNFLNMRVVTFGAADGRPGANVTLLVDATRLSLVRPLAGDVTDDGAWQMHEASYCVPSGMFFCLSNPSVGWLTPTQQDWGIMPPLGPSGARQPTLWGNRVVASDGSNITLGEAGASAIFGANAVTWITPSAGYAMKRADVPPSGGKVAMEVLRAAPGPGEPANLISIVPFSGGAEPPTLDPGNGCDMPQVGNAHSVTWSPDGTQIAWRDDRGLVVSGAPILPSPVDAICRLATPPVVITSRPASTSTDNKGSAYSTTGGPAFGGVDVAAMAAARTAAPVSSPAPGAVPAPSTVTRGSVTAPASASLSGSIPFTIAATKRGVITAVGRIPASLARRLRIPVVVARGTVIVRRSGKVTLSLRPTATGRRSARNLRGKTMVVTVTVPGQRTVRVPITLR